jgi:hypothetical protein
LVSVILDGHWIVIDKQGKTKKNSSLF